jgi:hypothetical protein
MITKTPVERMIGYKYFGILACSIPIYPKKVEKTKI